MKTKVLKIKMYNWNQWKNTNKKFKTLNRTMVTD